MGAEGSQTPPDLTAPKVGWKALILRPGSVDRSQSIWWAIPLAVLAVSLLTALGAIRALDPLLIPQATTLDVLTVAGGAATAWSILIVLTQSESATELSGGRVDLGGRHRFWRARTIAWDSLAISGAGTALVSLLRVGPNSVLPPADVPLAELAVLVVTLALLASFSRYAAMCFSTDAKSVTQKLEELSKEENAARTSDRELTQESFKNQTDRLVAKVEEQIAATTLGLSQVSQRLQDVAKAIEKQLKVATDAKEAATRATEVQEETLREIRETEARRVRAVEEAALARADRIAPKVSAILYAEGTIRHRLNVGVYNEGFDARGLRIVLSATTGATWTFTDSGLASKSDRYFVVDDVSLVPDATQFALTVELQDVDGGRHLFRSPPIHYDRETGWFRRTKGIRVTPSGWNRLSEVIDTVSGRIRRELAAG